MSFEPYAQSALLRRGDARGGEEGERDMRNRHIRLLRLTLFLLAAVGCGVSLFACLYLHSTEGRSAARAEARWPSPPPAGHLSVGATDSRSTNASLCTPLDNTELWGDVVVWGDSHKTDSALACCAALAAQSRANVYVYCSSPEDCGDAHKACWLKHLDDPWEDLPLVQGRSAMWTSGIKGGNAPPATLKAAPVEPPPVAFALVTPAGDIRIRLREEACPRAAKFVLEVLRVAPSCSGCKFYRAEPVPRLWGSLDAPDSWNGGRWGPPYALMQGSLMPSKADEEGMKLPARPDADEGKLAHPIIRRGMIAWAGGKGGSDFFIALATHPEWGHGHVVWAEVVAEDMDVVDKVMQLPKKNESWGSIVATVFVDHVPFSLRGESSWHGRIHAK